MRPPDPRLLEFLMPYDRSIVELMLALRELVLTEAPDAVEAIYDAYSAVAVGYSFTGRFSDSFVHIATYTKHVNLGFNRGATLRDPHKVLEGSGKAIRHIRIASTADLERPYLPQYIREAIAQVPAAGALPSKKSIVRGNYPVKRRPTKT